MVHLAQTLCKSTIGLMNLEPQQQIRFCTSADGTRLAVATLGKGMPLVKAATWLTHIEKEPHNLFTRHWVSELSRNHSLIRYDSRGCGLSQRDVERISMDAWVEDLEAVISILGEEQFALFGMSQGAAIAVNYAAKHPDRISHLVLYGACARGLLKRNPSAEVIDAAQAMLKAAELGWGANSSSFRQVFIAQLLRDASAEQQRAVDDAQRSTISGANAVRFIKEVFEIDLQVAAPMVKCPTLVFHAKEDPCFPFEEGRLLASLIPHARFVPLASKNHLPFETEAAWPVFLSELSAFLPQSRAEAATVDINKHGVSETSKPLLTPRQIQILREVAQGQTDKEIARKLSLSPRTVEMHVANALLGLNCRTRAEAVRCATELELLIH